MSKIITSFLKDINLKNIANKYPLFLKRQCLFSSSISPSAKTELPTEVDLEQIRKEFRKFEGGLISLTKDEESGIAYICLDHVEKKNGFSGKMMVDLSEAVSALENWSTGKAVILYGKGDMFCSGGYLDTVKRICTPEDGFKMSSLMQDSVIRLARLPLASVSVVHGKALGGGAELILSTDFRVFTPSADVRFVEANMGVGTGWGGGTSLRRLVGHSLALDLLLTCRKIPLEEALRIGLANEIIKGDNPLQEAVDWIKKRIDRHEPCVVHTVKQIVSSNNYEDEKGLFAPSWGGKVQLNALSSNIKHK